MKNDNLDNGIRKLLESVHGEKIDEKVEAKMAELKAELESKLRPQHDITPLVSGIRSLGERTSRIESDVERLEKSGKKTGEVNEGRLILLMQKEIEKITSDLMEKTGKNKDRIDDLQSQVSGIRDLFKEMKQIHEDMKSVDLRSMARDIESIKQKISWLEQNNSTQGIEEIRERLAEVESQVKSARSGSPLVLE